MNVLYGVKPENFKLKYGSDFTEQAWETHIDLVAVKNSHAAFQILLTADRDYAVTVGTTPWFSQHIDRNVVRISADCAFETELRILDMHPDDEGIFTADALLTSDTVELMGNEPRTVWVEMKIPADTEIGSYYCTIKLIRGCTVQDEAVLGTLTANVEVLDLTLPAPCDFTFHLDLWQHLSNIARQHEVPLFGDAHFEVLEKYVRSLADLGQKAVTLVVSEAPWSGQSCYKEERTVANLFEYSLIPVTKEIDGTFVYDYTIMQRYIDLCAKYGIRQELSIYGLCNVWSEPEAGLGAIAPDYPDGIKIRYLDRTDGTYRYMKTASEIDHYIVSLERYLKDTGQIDRVRISADEPSDIEAFRQSLTHLSEIAPSFKFKAAINHAEFIDAFGEEIHDFVPYIRGLSREFDRLKEYRRTMGDKRFLWYVCCSPDFLNTFLKSELAESWFIGVLTSYLEFDGFLRWSYTVWNDDPRKDGRYAPFPAGDTHLVYPSANGAPLLTLRYKALKRGIELFELLRQLKATGDEEAIKAAFRLVIREKDVRKYAEQIKCSAELCSLDHRDYQSLMRWIAKKIDSKH